MQLLYRGFSFWPARRTGEFKGKLWVKFFGTNELGSVSKNKNWIDLSESSLQKFATIKNFISVNYSNKLQKFQLINSPGTRVGAGGSKKHPKSASVNNKAYVKKSALLFGEPNLKFLMVPKIFSHRMIFFCQTPVQVEID